MKYLVVLLLLLQVTWGMWNKAMENPNLFGGDMVMTPEEINAVVNGTHGYGSIVGGRWPGAKVPYIIDSSISQKGRNAIQQAINDYHQYTCLRWVPRTNELIYVNFFFGDGCSSPVGYMTNIYRRINHISLGTGCQSKGTAIHEMGHTIGLFHEQNRPDRNKFIQINKNQVKEGMYYNFQTENNVNSLGTAYDLRSIMHYSSKAFAIGKSYTIQTIDPSKQYLIDHGDRISEFSRTDIQQINLMYNCKSTGKYPVCKNYNKSCEQFARRNPSECIKSPEYMHIHCPKACGICI